MTGVYRSDEGARAVREGYRAFLERWPVPSEHLRIPTRQGETFAVACGPPEGPPVVLLHGSGANSAMWMPDVAAWSSRLRVHAVDVIGEPGLSAPSRPPLGSDAYAQWFDDVLDGLGLARTAVVAVSLGAWLALDHAIRRPGRVTRLALLSPGGVGRQKIGVLLAAPALLPFGRWGRRRLLRLALGPVAVRPEAAGREYGAFVLLVHRHFRPRRDRLPVFGDEALAGVAAPMLVVAGGRDAMLDSHDTARRLGRAVPGADVRLLPEAGHLLPRQTEPILGFLLEGVDVPAGA
ncbi:alpha/beta hydrolase [Microbispora corallina]|uniref:Ndr family protein n=1 Tax=Microbispora corallina TaxID=83302 RepID=A0ABQ4G644_9ACTN|nr:alpha/beta hydrolase [Microbispora corallina]GIH42505.1 Ndr family protein [Microbispora corallina]